MLLYQGFRHLTAIIQIQITIQSGFLRAQNSQNLFKALIMLNWSAIMDSFQGCPRYKCHSPIQVRIFSPPSTHYYSYLSIFKNTMLQEGAAAHQSAKKNISAVRKKLYFMPIMHTHQYTIRFVLF